jgi:hypothetical protein
VNVLAALGVKEQILMRSLQELGQYALLIGHHLPWLLCFLAIFDHQSALYAEARHQKLMSLVAVAS